MKLSKNLTSGCFVQMRGDKLCRVNNLVLDDKGRKRVLGVFHPCPTIISAKTRLLNGELHQASMDVPAGIRVRGFDQVEVKKEKK